MNRIFRCWMQVLIGVAAIVSVLHFDPQANQTFREPKIIAVLWLAATAAAFWGFWNLFRGIAGNRPLLPPIQFVSLFPLAGLLLHRFWIDYHQIDWGLTTGRWFPLSTFYHIHILLPVLAWLIILACSSFSFQSRRSRRELGTLILIVLAIETTVVFLETIESVSGIPANPVGWFGEIEVAGTLVKKWIFGTIGNPNFVAGYLAVALLPALGWTLGCRTVWARIPGCAVVFSASLALVSTRSKGAILALGFGLGHLCIAGWLSRKKRWEKRRNPGMNRALTWTFVTVMVLVVLFGGFLLADKSTNTTEGSYASKWVETASLRGDSITVRAVLAHCGLQMWRQAPWVGLGPGGFKINFLENLKGIVEDEDSEKLKARVSRLHSLRANHLHNEYLQVLVEWGIIGLVFLELFFVWCQTQAFHLIRMATDARDRWMRLGLLSGFWCGLGGSFFDLPFHRPAQAFLLAILLGSSLAGFPALAQRSPPTATGRQRLSAVGMGIIALVIAALMLPQALARYSSLRDVFWARLVVEGTIPFPDTQKAIRTVRKAKNAVPGEGEYDFLLARYLLFIENDPNSAIAQIRESRKTCDNPGLFLLEARAQIERKNFDAAEPLLSFMEALDPHAAGLHYMKGEVYRERGKWNEACASFLAEINRYQTSGLPPDRDVENSYILLATILEERLGQFSEAARYYQDYLDLQDETVVGYPHAQLRLGAMFRDRFFDLDRSEKYFKEALDALEQLGLSKESETVRKEIAQIEERRMKYQLGL